MDDEMESERSKFEEAAYRKYFTSKIGRNPDPHHNSPMEFVVGADCKTKDEFLKRDEHGKYEDRTVGSAWWGWRAALASRRT